MDETERLILSTQKEMKTLITILKGLMLELEKKMTNLDHLKRFLIEELLGEKLDE